MAELAGTSLIAGLWQGTALALAVWLCLRLVPGAGPRLRFRLWAAVFATIALLPLVNALAARQGLVPAAHAAVRLDPRWGVGSAGLWLFLSALRLAELVASGLRLRALQRRARPRVLPAGAACLLSQSARGAVLCTSDEVERPAVIGFWSPCILLPEWLFAQLPPVDLEQILLHEVEHLRRWDDWLNLLQKLALVIIPWNPALLWVERRLCLERELACDDGVVRQTHAPRAYAACLTAVAERGLDRRAVSLALGALERESELGRRVGRILRREASMSPMMARMVTGLVAMVLVAGSVGLARCPQLVSFAVPAQVATTSPVSISSIVYAEQMPMRAQVTMTSLIAADARPRGMKKRAKVNRHVYVVVHRDQAAVAVPRETLAETTVPESVVLEPVAQPMPARYAIVPSAYGWLLIRL